MPAAGDNQSSTQFCLTLFYLQDLCICINAELWTSLIELHFQYSKAELLPGQIFTNDSSYSRYLCKGNGSNQTELAIITGDINVKLFTQPRSFWEREYCFRHVGPQRHHKGTTKGPQRDHKGTTKALQRHHKGTTNTHFVNKSE